MFDSADGFHLRRAFAIQGSGRQRLRGSLSGRLFGRDFGGLRLVRGARGFGAYFHDGLFADFARGRDGVLLSGSECDGERSLLGADGEQLRGGRDGACDAGDSGDDGRPLRDAGRDNLRGGELGDCDAGDSGDDGRPLRGSGRGDLLCGGESLQSGHGGESAGVFGLLPDDARAARHDERGLPRMPDELRVQRRVGMRLPGCRICGADGCFPEHLPAGDSGQLPRRGQGLCGGVGRGSGPLRGQRGGAMLRPGSEAGLRPDGGRRERRNGRLRGHLRAGLRTTCGDRPMQRLHGRLYFPRRASRAVAGRGTTRCFRRRV